VLFLITLNVNTILCQRYIDEKVVSQSKKKGNRYFISVLQCILIYLFTLVYGSENKQILMTKNSVIFFKKFLKFLGREPNIDLRKLSVNELKFELKLEISLLEIVTVKNDNNNKKNEAVD
jgi:hypothetical protein